MNKNDEWVKLHKENDITDRLTYWAQNEDMIDQYYNVRGQDLIEASAKITELRQQIRLYFTAFNKAAERIKELEGYNDA
jgi:hypothetical protein